MPAHTYHHGLAGLAGLAGLGGGSPFSSVAFWEEERGGGSEAGGGGKMGVIGSILSLSPNVVKTIYLPVPTSLSQHNVMEKKAGFLSMYGVWQ